MPRLFFALQPPAPERAAITAAALPLGVGDPVHRDDLHLTLCFLGEVPQERVAAVCEAASTVPSCTWHCTLVAAEHWARPRILCLLPEEDPGTQAMAALATRLRQAMLAIGLAPEAMPFRPHLTVKRRVPTAGSAAGLTCLAPALPMHAEGFVLMQSQAGTPRYRVLQSWLPPAAGYSVCREFSWENSRRIRPAGSTNPGDDA